MIFMACVFAAAIGVLSLRYRDGTKVVPLDRVNLSTTPDNAHDRGPAYLLSNLPRHRVTDDYAEAVSYPTGCS